MNCSPTDLPVHNQLLELAQTHIHQVGDAIQQFHLLLSSYSPDFNLSQHQGLFKWVRSLQQVVFATVRSLKQFQFQHQSSNEYLEQISFRIDWFDHLAVQGTLKSLLQHHSSKASIFWCSVFFIVQLSHPYVTTGRTMTLTRWTFVDKAMSLLFNMLSRLLVAFLPRNKHLLISCLQAPSAVALEPPNLKSVTISIVSSSICH